MPPRSLDVITDAAGVARVVDDVRQAGRFAVDFEFLWERTYAPQPCLAQIAVRDEVHLIDPIAGAPLAPVADLIADPGLETIMHAPSADLTLLSLQYGARPARMTDVQLIAGFVGLGAGQGLATLLERVLKVRLDKGEQYTDWSRRPLTAKQLVYAGADVENLMPLHDELLRRAAAMGRTDWVHEEHARRYGEGARWSPDPAEAWRRVKGQGKLSGRDRAVLAALARWREQEAARRDRPAQWICPDRTLLEIARRRPATREELMRERGLPERMRPQDADAMLAAIADGADAAPINLPAPPPPEVAHRLETLGPLGQILVAARSAEVDLAPSLLATRDEVETYLAAVIAGGDRESSPLGTGWRHALAGAALEDLAAGRIALGASPRRPFLREIPVP
ncbi:MAG TPA: HRDC domain-containing protein [Miltoncostaeaceae bacterium]|nr:HRDC domain-containing protein [Miltoncostaeaceae bacterium]